jgi:ABC-type lipoprotein export system ATPase subunit
MSLTLTRVGHRYGSQPPVLVDVELDVDDDETVAIVGPSGSGKTTLLSIVGGLLKPTSGEVNLDGWRIGRDELPPGSLSWVFQTINLFGRRTALENVAVGIHAVGARRVEVRVRAAEMLARVGLEGREDEPVNRLSGGQAQRVGIARALVGRPRYVLVDEPTGQLDRSTSEMIAEILFAARPVGTSVIAATHDPLIASQCRRRYAVIDGRLRAEA